MRKDKELGKGIINFGNALSVIISSYYYFVRKRKWL
jgi:hypothetical protein